MPRLLHLGDSYTVGTGIDPAGSWPCQLQARLTDLGHTVETTIIAQNGWTTLDLAAAIDAANLTPPYDLVTLLIGVNDQFDGLPFSEYARHFDALLGFAIRLAGRRSQRTIVLSIPDYSVTPFLAQTLPDLNPAALATELNRWNAVNRRITHQAHAHYIDVTPMSRAAAQAPAQLLAPDGLHPSAALYARWLEPLLPLATHILSPQA